jgi:hypothetical protein
VIDKKMCGSPDEAEYHTLSAKLGASWLAQNLAGLGARVLIIIIVISLL